ncbi:MAG TPA: hypothetical protein H9761_06110 [Candidatus Eisenbergiella merdavium]|uniref:PIN domain-containing protein n=1 Tax=Candidatus Eisenbergiella merdavium TaxID=2838551 RepID=A0A9D2ND52_9FIRM|nr:hypothetical protein [Candidatus Eisenbergiella merdavium]
MNVRFMDTSIVMNLLEIPGMCQDAEKVKKEFNQAVEAKETLILPVSTIIESGNHIAHIADGHIRREKAMQFQEFLRKTANEEAPWTLYGVTLTKEDLLVLAEEFPGKALHLKMGIGDMSIIRFYENYKATIPAIGRIMIWSTDSHLSDYQEDMTIRRRRNR